MNNGSDQEYLTERVLAWLSRPKKPSWSQELPELGAAIGTTVGEVRRENEDRGIVARFTSHRNRSESFSLLALCDGMGGMLDGARCAELALAHVLTSVFHSETADRRGRLLAGIELANRAVYAEKRGRGGTTIAAVLMSRNDAVAITVGDTRLYVFTPPKVPELVSTDDTIAGEVSRIKGIDATRDLGHLAEGLAQFVGMGPGIEPRSYAFSAARNGTTYCLSSDGAHGVGSPIFERILGLAPGPYAAVTRLLQLSRWSGGKDNASVIVAAAGSVDAVEHTAAAKSPLLEIWDSFGKVEFLAMPPHRNTQVEPRLTHVPVEPGRLPPGSEHGREPPPGRHPASMRKQAAKSSRSRKQGASPKRDTGAQRKLQIEIGENPKNTADAQSQRSSDPVAPKQDKPRSED